jgi:hypothetical protein
MWSLSSGSNDSISLDEVVLHVSLEIEISELILLTELEELGKTRIGIDLASIALVLKTIGVDVSVNLLAYLGSGHLSTDGLAEELSQLIADTCRLDEARGLAVGIDATLLGRSLLGILHLTRDDLLKRLVVVLEGRKNSNKKL